MKRLLIAIGILTVLFFIVLCIGFFLPDQRIETRRIIIKAPKEDVFTRVTDNSNWQYRSDLKNLTIIAKNSDKEIWIETNLNGQETRFKTREKIPYLLYSFEMESSKMKGYWVSQFRELEDNQTELITTMYIQITNPLLKVVSFLFFEPNKYMQTYEYDLKRALE